ncbi:MAG TPA: hypothetical protein PK357_02035 [Candidatus Pacearchaeota archaeon]|nr:hypothetical protein [Candidatus Pacearchaeota archaeon]
MGFFRGAGLTILSIILFFVLLIGGLFATLSLSLKYENVYPKIYSLADKFAETQIGEEQFKEAILLNGQNYCMENEEFVQDIGGYVIVFPCSVIQEGYESSLDYGINYIIKDLYYKQYSCFFLDCFDDSQIPLFLISEYSQKFWTTLCIKFLIFSIVLFGLIFLLVKKKPSSLIVLGSLMVPISLLILLLKKAGEFFALSSLTGEEEIMSLIGGIFFSETSTVFLRMLVVGGVLILVGIILRIIFSKSKEKINEEKPKEDKKIIENKPIKSVIKKSPKPSVKKSSKLKTSKKKKK